MSMSDPIADMLTRIRNAQAAQKLDVVMFATKIKTAIAGVLKAEGYISDYAVEADDGKKKLVITLKYYNGKAVIDNIRRISRPGLRVYRNKNKLPHVMGGMGIAIVSTSKGIMSDRAARLLGEGGEVLCYVS
ncbi:MAG: 30S ribosomal protein S8 [uncultured bacterium]|nr:MAG: 30S ribosomal protein S8 [uncultured bacterium]HBC71306.1 30S ribosomal protein S8 [Coxiellaceae bacterium]HBS51678.1 30S ribosomal protein S8 [Coxiellaceae bacterium]HBY55370.1 30S ribosomal protein S8 [Coxiellaceae bacterium]